MLCSAKLVLCVVSNHPRLSSMFCPHAGDSKACKCKDCTYTVCWWLVFRMPQLICVSCATFFLSLFCFFACSLFPPCLIIYFCIDRLKLTNVPASPSKKPVREMFIHLSCLVGFRAWRCILSFRQRNSTNTHTPHTPHTHTHTHIHTYIHTYTHIQTHLLARCTPN